MTPTERTNAQLDIIEAARLNPGIDWRMKKMFGQPCIMVDPDRAAKAANKLVRELAKIPGVVEACRAEIARAFETDTVDRRCEK